jgi:hypothetical protein
VVCSNSQAPNGMAETQPAETHRMEWEANAVAIVVLLHIRITKPDNIMLDQPEPRVCDYGLTED